MRSKLSTLLAITLGVALAPDAALAASLMPQGKQAYTDSAGNPLAGGLLYTYAAGTSTPLATYSDQAGTIPNANPVVLDSRGEASIFWGTGPYKVTLRTSADVPIWTQDNLYPPLSAGIPLPLIDGSASVPALSWSGDTNSGFYRIGNDDIGLSLGGTKRWEHTTAGQIETGWAQFAGSVSVGGAITLSGPVTFGGSVSGLTRAALPSLVQQVSGSSGAFVTTSGTAVDVTNMSATITTSGRPVMIAIEPDGVTTTNLGHLAVSNPSVACALYLYLVRDSTVISSTELQGPVVGSSSPIRIPSSHVFFDTPAAGTHTYKVQLAVTPATTTTGLLYYSTLTAFEL